MEKFMDYYNMVFYFASQNCRKEAIKILREVFGDKLNIPENNISRFYMNVYYCYRGLVEFSKINLSYENIELILDTKFGKEWITSVENHIQGNDRLDRIYTTLHAIEYLECKDEFNLAVLNDDNLFKLKIEKAILNEDVREFTKFKEILTKNKLKPSPYVDKWFQTVINSLSVTDTLIEKEIYFILCDIFPDFSDQLLDISNT